MTDKEYRQVVNETLRSHEFYVATVLYYRSDMATKNLTWLRLMGLMETWDMI